MNARTSSPQSGSSSHSSSTEATEATGQTDAEGELRERIASELAVPVRESVQWLAREIAALHGDTVLGVLFYGSCLRKETDEGVLDFWVIVDDYRSAYAKSLPALVNPVAPPNVFYVEREYPAPSSHASPAPPSSPANPSNAPSSPGEPGSPGIVGTDGQGSTLRTKYGVIDREAFAKGNSLRSSHPYIWARFAQPARLVLCRDEEARSYFVETISSAVITLVGRIVCQLPQRDGLFRFSLKAFWHEAFRRTYDSERRPEAAESILNLYHEDEARYDAVATYAIHILAEKGHFASATEHPNAFAVEIPDYLAQKRRWTRMRSHARALGLIRLLKTAFTFGDWVPYVLWKLERHTGRKIELTERQRKHPLIFAWPVIIPLLRKRNLR